MENNERKNNSLTELMEASMSKIRDMVDSNTASRPPSSAAPALPA